MAWLRRASPSHISTTLSTCRPIRPRRQAVGSISQPLLRRGWLLRASTGRRSWATVVSKPVAQTDPGLMAAEPAIPARVMPGWARRLRQVWVVRGFWLGLLAVGVGAVGEGLLAQEETA